MATFEEVLTRFEVTRADVAAWIEEGLIEPRAEGENYVFDETDMARIGLIIELRRDLEIDDSAIPVVLSLLDQLHAARAALKRIAAAIADLPPETRDHLTAVLGEHASNDG